MVKLITIILLPLSISEVIQGGLGGEILVWDPTDGCSQTVAGTRTAEKLEKLQS